MNVIDLVTTPLKRVATTKGGEYHGPCPSCGGKDRFHVWPQENHGEGSWWCRQCGSGGDGIQYLRDFENMTFKEACNRLGKELKKPMHAMTPRIPTAKNTPTKPETPSPLPQAPFTPGARDPEPPDTWMEKAESFVTWATQQLLYVKQTRRQPPEDPGATQCRQWLEARGINEIEMQVRRLGYNPGEKEKDIFRPRSAWGLPPDLKENGQNKKLWIPRGLVIPNLQKGRVTRLRIRRPEGDPRYYVIPGSRMDCMLTKHLPGRPAYTIVESELDLILVNNEAGDMTGTIALGNSSRKPDPATWEALQKARIVLIALDHDPAGDHAARWWSAQIKNTRRILPPKGKDPGEAYQAGVNIRAWIGDHLPKGWFL